MRGKNILIILLTVLVLLSAAVLGVSTVYRINEVSVVASTISEAAKAEAEELRLRLMEAYDKQSSFSVTSSEAEAVIEEFPYFRIQSFEKKYPNRIVVKVSEDAEVYALPKENGEYYILGEDGTVLSIRENPANRSDGAENVLLLVDPALTVTGVKGELLQGDEFVSCLFEFCKEMSRSTALNGIRRNVLSVAVVRMASLQSETMLKLTMREGVKIYVHNPLSMTREKAELAVNEYMGLTPAKRLKGMIAIWNGETSIEAEYSAEDGFEGAGA